MKIKELQKTVNVAWSPGQLNEIYLSAGTAAQQLDASPNTTSTIEIYSANLLDPSYDLELKGTQSSKYRFQKIVWSPTGINNGQHHNGLIVGGCEGGHIQIYSASKLLSNCENGINEDALVAHQDKHTGTVRGLDFNPFQHNLLASVASESEIFIWDLNNTTTPMAPGTKTQPLEDIQNVSWNRQVQHILASVFSSKCVIWDLRKNEQIIKLNDSQSRVRWRAIQWHPDVATQLWLASEEDQSPYVQLWDLRYATAPAKTMQIHQRGILGLTWCPKDSDLMVSCGKDNKILCWNPNTDIPEGEILSEIATTIQWYSDVQWCPRNPALICSSSFDGNVSIYSLFGGSQQQVQTSNKIADSFPGMDQFAQPHPQQTSHITYPDLKRAPKWMKRQRGISFGFGGRLLIFDNKNSSKIVNICQVVTDPNLIERSNALEKVIDEGQFIEFCKQKADKMQDQHGRYVWYFIKANFEQNPRAEMLNLLGYNYEDIKHKFDRYVNKNDGGETNGAEVETATNHQVDQLTKQMSLLSRSDSSEVECDQSTDDSTDLSGGDNNAIFNTITSENKILNNNTELKSFKIPIGDNDESLICQAILTGNIEAAAEICMEFNRPAEALIIASTAGRELLNKIQAQYLNKNYNNELTNIINALITSDWFDIAKRCTIDSWKEALVAALTHSEDQTSYLCDKIGERLQNELSRDTNLAKNSLLCYICAGNIEKLVESWLLIRNSESVSSNNSKLKTDELQDLIEIVMILKKSLEIRGQNLQPTGKLAEFLAQYAGLLASQGALNSALSYLGPSQDPDLEDLRERLYYALGHKRQQTFSRGSVSQTQQSQANMYGKQMTVTTNRYGQQRTNSFSNQSNSGFGGQQNNFNPTMPSVLPASTNRVQQWNSTPIQSQPPAPWNMNPLQQSSSAVPPLHSYDSQQNSLSSMAPAPPSSTSLSGPPPLATSQVPPPTSKPPLTATNDGISRPQRPSSVGSQGTTPLSRAKYVLDPSVTSGPNYGQTMGVYNTQTQFNSSPYGQFNNNNNMPPTSTTFYQPSQMPPVIPPSSQSMQNNFQPFNPAPLAQPPTIPATNLSTNSSGYLSGISPIETAQQALPPPPPSTSSTVQRNPTPPPGWNDPPALKSRQQTFYTQKNEMSAEHAGTRKWNKIINNSSFSSTTIVPTSSNVFQQQQQQQQQSQSQQHQQPQQQQQQSYQNFVKTNYDFNNDLITCNNLPNSNNDDLLMPSSLQQPKIESAPPLNPITHPIFGVDPNQQGQNGYPDSNLNYMNPQYQNQGGTLPPPPPTATSSSSSTTSNILSPQNQNMMSANSSIDSNKIYNPLNFQQPQQTMSPPPPLPPSNQSQMYQPYHHEPPAVTNPEPVEKPPLPEEFIYMQTVFEELKNQCQNIAPDPRTKRKFVDVTKRLESLYDVLRAKRLSQNTLSSLNQIVQYVQIGDYQNAMNVYMAIVSGPDFSQTANFMPGIKVLIQSASELKVYLR